MVRDISLRAPARVELLQPAIKIPQVPLRFCPFWNAGAVLAEHDGQYIGDRALLDHETAVHVGFAKPQLGIEQDVPFGGAGGKANRDRFTGAVAKDNLRSARGRESEGPPPDKGLEQKLKQPVHRTPLITPSLRLLCRRGAGFGDCRHCIAFFRRREVERIDVVGARRTYSLARPPSVRHIVVMFHDVRLLMTAVYADEYLVLQIKFAVGWLNQFEPQLATAEVAARRGRRLDEGAHVISFRPTCFGIRGYYFNPASSRLVPDAPGVNAGALVP